MKRFLLLLLVIALPIALFAQGTCKSDFLINRQGHAVPQATIYVCLNTASSTPCTPQAVIYSDPGLTSTVTQPLVTDNFGRYSFCVATAGRYMLQTNDAGVVDTNTLYVVSPGDTAPGVLTSQPYTDDGVTVGYLGSLTVPRNATVTAIHARANVPWTACTSAPVVTVYGKPQTTGETRHLFTALTIQAAAHPSSQTSLHYFTSGDATALVIPVLAGDELQLWWTPATGCAQYGSGIIITLDYEGSR